MNQWLASTEFKDVNSMQTSLNKGFKAHKNGLWHWTTDRQPHYEDLSGCKYSPPAPITWKRKPHPCHSWWFHSTGFCRWSHSAHWQPVRTGRSQERKMLSKDISPGLPEGDDFFLQQVSIGISDVIDEEQQMSTRDRNTSRNYNSCFTQIYKRWLLTDNIFSYLGHSFILWRHQLL